MAPASLPVRPPLPIAAAPLSGSASRATTRPRRGLGLLTTGFLLAIVAVAVVRETLGNLGRAIDRRFAEDEATDLEDDG